MFGPAVRALQTMALLTAVGPGAGAGWFPLPGACAPRQTGLQPIRYDDCGQAGKQPHVTNGSTWVFAEKDVGAPLPARTVAFDARALKLRYEGLDPAARYGVRITYATERTNPRRQRLIAEGKPVHGDLALPQGEAKQCEYALPDDVAADGAIDLSFELVSGHNAEVSEVWLLSDREQPVLKLEVSSDLRGGLTVTALNGVQEPVPGAQVTVTPPSVAVLQQTTGPDGMARFTLDVRGTPEGEVVIEAQAGRLTERMGLPLSSLLFGRPVLTPVPEFVAGVKRPVLDLCGRWRFSPAPPEGFEQPESDEGEWPPIEVPGEWVMQGHTVEPGKAAAYRRTVTMPADWQGQTVKLRFDAVYSRCEVWLNGVRLGGHEGGFTPFELDATAAARPGEGNVLALAVTSESLADTLASASGYARHQLGGITRKVTAFCVPATHLARLHVATDLDGSYTDAELIVTSETAGGGGDLRVRIGGVPGVAEGRGTLRVPVTAPELWDSEHPNLYELEAELLVDGRVVERVSRRVGFREVQVRGNQLLVNGQPVKLHGTCRHEASATRGRSLTPAIWKRDVELLKGCNINFVRTAHYPPAEEFIDLCDGAGIYVQEEGPYCWVGNGNESSPATLGLMLQQHAEMLERDLSHPSIILWDIANESAWGANFARLTEYTHAEDPTRPTLFSGAGVGAVDRPEQRPQIDDWHYPGPTGPERVANAERPVTFGEYCHLNCYNVAEVEADPGLRDYWGRALEPMWDAMYASAGCLGGTIWCWADDVFEVPGQGRVGYGEWGIIDAHQRPKPEWWHVRNGYAPVCIRARRIEPGTAVAIPIGNRFNHTDLSEVRCKWTVGERRGELRLDLAPHAQGELKLPVEARPGDTVELRFTGPDGRCLDEYVLPVGNTPTREEPRRPRSAEEAVRMAASLYVDSGYPDVVLTQQQTGADLVGAAETEATTVKTTDGGPAVKVSKRYAVGEASFTAEATAAGMRWRYRFTYQGPEVLVREIGLSRRLKAGFTQLTWQREGRWASYPRDHIGRPVGRALAFPNAPGGLVPWSLLPDPRGCNDFRSTRYNILRAALLDATGEGLEVLSDGTQHIRATVESDGVVLRVLDFSNGGGESFLAGHYGPSYRTLKAGDMLEGGATLRLVGLGD